MRDFASFLEDFVEPPVKPAAAGEDFSDDVASAAPSIPFGLVGGDPAGLPPESGPEMATAAYLGLNAEWVEKEAQPQTSPEAIARELSLHRVPDLKSLGRLRREFAFGNHPDRVRPEWRDAAMARMQTANRLIDEAKERLAGKHG